MPLTYQPRRSSLGGQTVVGLVTFDASYATNGLLFDPTKLGSVAYAQGPAFVVCNDVPTGAHQGKQAVWDPATGKLVALTAAGVEVANATDLSAMTVLVRVEYV